MHRAVILAPILMAASLGCATTHAQPSKPPNHPQSGGSTSPPAAAAKAVDEAPFVLDYRVADGTGKVILDGQTAISPPRPVVVDRRLPGSADLTTLSLQASRTPSHDLVVSLQYEEHTDKGGRLSWSPRVALPRGGTAEASIAFADGDGRNVTLTLK
jgi:hypothetical protein